MRRVPVYRRKHLEITRSVAKLFSGRHAARVWLLARSPEPDASRWLAQKIGGEWVEPARAWVREGRPIVEHDGRISIGRPKPDGLTKKPRPQLGDCLVGRVADLHVTRRIMSMLGAEPGDIDANTTARRCAREATRDGSWVRAGEAWVVDVTVDGAPHRWFVVERIEGEWWVGTCVPPVLPDAERRMAEDLRARGWAVYPPHWDIEGRDA